MKNDIAIISPVSRKILILQFWPTCQKEVRDEVDFSQAGKNQCFLKVDTISS